MSPTASPTSPAEPTNGSSAAATATEQATGGLAGTGGIPILILTLGFVVVVAGAALTVAARTRTKR